MDNNFLEAKAYSCLWNDSIDVVLRQRRNDGKIFIVTDMTTTELEQNMAIANPSFRITEHDAQVLIDSLWSCGLRPSEGKGSAGSLKATENHLNDMRQIVFKKLGI